MRLVIAISCSVLVHLGIIFLPALEHLAPRPHAPPLHARLIPPATAKQPPVENLSTVHERAPPPVRSAASLPPVAQGKDAHSRRQHEALVRTTQARLTRHLFYPPEAVRQGLEGEVVLLVTLDARGAVSDITVARSSGHALLDKAAMKAAGQLGRLRSGAGQFLLPVTFALE